MDVFYRIKSLSESLERLIKMFDSLRTSMERIKHLVKGD